MTQAIHGAGRPALVRVGSHRPVGDRPRARPRRRRRDRAAASTAPYEAAAIVSACRYQPAGRRSWGRVRGEAGEEPLVLAMIETRAGLEAVDEIAATEGLDGVYIGPSDLIARARRVPDARGSSTPWCSRRSRRSGPRRRRAGVLCGLHCLSGEDAARFVPEGFPMVTAGADGGLLRAALAAALRRAGRAVSGASGAVSTAGAAGRRPGGRPLMSAIGTALAARAVEAPALPAALAACCASARLRSTPVPSAAEFDVVPDMRGQRRTARCRRRDRRSVGSQPSARRRRTRRTGSRARPLHQRRVGWRTRREPRS